MAKSNISGSKIPIFTGRAIELQKKGNVDMEGLACNYTERSASECFRVFLERNFNPSWKELGINGHFASQNMTEVARALVEFQTKTK